MFTEMIENMGKRVEQWKDNCSQQEEDKVFSFDNAKPEIFVNHPMDRGEIQRWVFRSESTREVGSQKSGYVNLGAALTLSNAVGPGKTA